MDNVDISIGGRRFRLQCGPGEVQRVQQLARLVDQCAASLIQGQGGMGEEKVLLLSSLTLADRLEEARAEVDRLRGTPARHRTMDAFSARNRFPGTVTSVEVAGVMALVEIEAGPHRITAAITRDAVEELGLVPGTRATAAVKATSVMVEREGGGARAST